MSHTLKALFISLIFHISIVSTFLYAEFKPPIKKEIVFNLAMLQKVKRVKEVTQKHIEKINEEIKPIKEVKKEPTKQKPKVVKKIISKPTPKLKPKVITKLTKKVAIKREESKPKIEKKAILKKETFNTKEPTKKIVANPIKTPPQKIVKKITQKPKPNYQKEYLNIHLSDIIKAIKKHTIYPYKAKKRGLEGRVILSCKFCKSGELKEIEIIQSSNFKILDENSIEILKIASKEFSKPKEDIRLTIPFNYYLN